MPARTGNPAIRDWMPPGDSIWACPCGYSGKYMTVVSHRKGWKKRPDCAKGKMYLVTPGADYMTDHPDYIPPHGPAQLTAPVIEPPRDTHAADIPEPVFTEDGEVANAEEIAAQINRHSDPLGIINLDAYQAGEPGSNGHGSPYLGFESGLPPGEWDLQEAPPGSPISEARESVQLPVVVRLMYDWVRGQGWNQGDGSISAFVWDMISDHWSSCMGKVILVANREDVNDGTGTLDSGPETAGAGADAKA